MPKQRDDRMRTDRATSLDFIFSISRAVKTWFAFPASQTKRPRGSPAPPSASDAGGSLRECDPRTSAILRSALQWPSLRLSQVLVEFPPRDGP